LLKFLSLWHALSFYARGGHRAAGCPSALWIGIPCPPCDRDPQSPPFPPCPPHRGSAKISRSIMKIKVYGYVPGSALSTLTGKGDSVRYV